MPHLECTPQDSVYTSLRDCDSSIGVWNDPPSREALGVERSTCLGDGRIHLLDDVSIAALAPLFPQLKDQRVGCLIADGPLRGRAIYQRGECLLPRYLREAGVLCTRLFPSPVQGFVDELGLFFWPVSLQSLDTILWVQSGGDLPASMRTFLTRQALRAFVCKGGTLYLGARATHLPYLLDDGFEGTSWPGLQHVMVQARLTPDLDMCGLSDRCVRIDPVDTEGRVVSAGSGEVRHYPYGWESRHNYDGGLQIAIRVAFAGQDQVSLEWRFSNTGPESCRVGLKLTGGPGPQPWRPLPEGEGGVTWSTPGVDWGLTIRWTQPFGAPAIDLEEGFHVVSDPVALPPEAEVAGRVLVQLDVDVPTGRKPDILPCGAHGGDRLWDKAADRWQQQAASLPSIPGSSGATSHASLLRRALATIRANLWTPPPALASGLFGSRRILMVQRGYYPAWYGYESPLYAVGLVHIDPQLARDQITAAVVGQGADGLVPISLENSPTDTRTKVWTQPPVLAFGTWQTHLRSPDTAFLETMYGPLTRCVDWWYGNRQVKPGVFGFTHAQEGSGDDHPRADEVWGGLRTGMRNWVSPDACGFVLMALQCLRRMAVELGRDEDEKILAKKIVRLCKDTWSVCHDPESGMFQDAALDGSGFMRCLSPWHFVPLWAGINVDVEEARRMIEQHLIPNFLGPVPFPIVAPGHPAHLADAYWRGPSWPQLWGIMLRTLWWYGFQEEADQAADRLLDMCAQQPSMMEIYDARNGEGLSLPEYSFAATAILDMLYRGYRDAPPWEIAR